MNAGPVWRVLGFRWELRKPAKPWRCRLCRRPVEPGTWNYSVRTRSRLAPRRIRCEWDPETKEPAYIHQDCMRREGTRLS
jgi:hypothetical protein